VKINRYVLGELGPAARRDLLARVQADLSAVTPAVAEIVDGVRDRGDEALLEYTRRFDGATLDAASLVVGEDEFEQAEAAVDPDLRGALAKAVANIASHHRAQLPTMTWMKETVPGVLTGERWTPIASVGLYVPRGKGSFPSVMAMLCTPAVLAGVPRIVVCTPPGPDGSVDAASLVAARLCGVRTVFRVGGAQAIAALALGTATIERVEKVVGPGNQYVTAAKRLLSGRIDPGPPAGPSESVVLCDASADPGVVARELLVEAEHGPDSAVLLVTDSALLLERVAELIPELVAALPARRREFCQAVLGGYGGLVLARTMAEAVEFVNDYAPEHLRVIVERPFDLLSRIQHAGEVLLGEHSSIPFGNFAIGVNAILPTGGTARSHSCVGVHDFLKRSSFAYVSPEGAREIGPIAIGLADYEGFPAHAEAASHTLRRADRAATATATGTGPTPAAGAAPAGGRG
jgi:histidinol dehydrogenase